MGPTRLLRAMRPPANPADALLRPLPATPRQRSTARQRVDLGAARRWRLRGPRFAGIAAGPDLAAIGCARHQARVVFVEHDLEHRVRHWATDVDLRPGFAAVAATQQDAEIADKTRPGCYPEMARIAWHLADVAAIDLPFGVERFERHMGPVVAAIGTAPHPGASDAEHGPRTPAACQHAVHVDHIVVDVLAVAQILPMLAAVGRADRTADLDRAVEVIGLAGAGVEHQD